MNNHIEDLKPRFQTQCSSSNAVIRKEDSLIKATFFPKTQTTSSILLILAGGVMAVTTQQFLGMDNRNLLGNSNVTTRTIRQNDIWVLTEPEKEFDDFALFNTSIALKPKEEFNIEITIQSIEKGKINFFPNEFEDLW